MTRTAPLVVLHVEDSDLDAQLLRLQLEATCPGAVDLRRCADLDSALEDLGAVDIVLLDLGLPGCSGLDALARTLEVAGPRPVIVVSGHPDPSLPRRAVAAGAAAFVEKGGPPEDLVAMLRRVLCPTARPDRG